MMAFRSERFSPVTRGGCGLGGEAFVTAVFEKIGRGEGISFLICVIIPLLSSSRFFPLEILCFRTCAIFFARRALLVPAFVESFEGSFRTARC